MPSPKEPLRIINLNVPSRKRDAEHDMLQGRSVDSVENAVLVIPGQNPDAKGT